MTVIKCKYHQNGCCPMGIWCPHYDNQDVPVRTISLNGSETSHDQEFEDFMFATGLHQLHVFANTPHGSRFLQRKLEEGNVKTTTTLFQAILPYFCDLMLEPYSKFVCVHLLQQVTDQQRIALIENALPTIDCASLNLHGSIVVQSMIEHITSRDQVIRVVQIFSPIALYLINTLSGSHVIQRCLSKFSMNDTRFIYETVLKHFKKIALNRNGCYVIQRLLDVASLEQRRIISYEILKNFYELVSEEGSTFLVQHILKINDPVVIISIASRMRGNVVTFAQGKFSSYALETCFHVADADTRRELIDEIYASWATLDDVVRNEYGNYVVQTTVKYADLHHKWMLKTYLEAMLPWYKDTILERRLSNILNKIM